MQEVGYQWLAMTNLWPRPTTMKKGMQPTRQLQTKQTVCLPSLATTLIQSNPTSHKLASECLINFFIVLYDLTHCLLEEAFRSVYERFGATSDKDLNTKLTAETLESKS